MSEPTMISLTEAKRRNPDENPLGMSDFWDSEGGRKCIVCYKYRRQDDLFIPYLPEENRPVTNPGHAHGLGIHISAAGAPICSACLSGEEKTP